jgi:hypothetical protein
MDGDVTIARLNRFLPPPDVLASLREKMDQYDKLSRQLESYQEYGGSSENIELTLNLLSAIIDDVDALCLQGRIQKPLRYNGIVVMRRLSRRPVTIIRDDDCIDISREIRVCKTPQLDADQELPF